jgi:hypothetical protein
MRRWAWNGAKQMKKATTTATGQEKIYNYIVIILLTISIPIIISMNDSCNKVNGKHMAGLLNIIIITISLLEYIRDTSCAKISFQTQSLSIASFNL